MASSALQKSNWLKKFWHSLQTALPSLVFSSIRAAETAIHSKIHVNGIDVYYELLGTGVPIVLIAGFSCDHHFWDGVVLELSKHYQVLRFDNRGVGQTDSPDEPYTVDLMADDAMSLIKALGLEKPIIIGQSMGSAIGQSIGRRYGSNISKLILINTFDRLFKAPEIAFELTGQLQSLKLPIKYLVQSIVPWVFSSDFLTKPNQFANLIKLAETNPYPQTVIGYQRQLEALKEFNSKGWLHQLRTPTLIIAAEEDIIAPASNAKDVFNSIGDFAKLLMIPGGHASPIEQPDKLTQAIFDFVDDLI